ncbi:MAG TPA: phage holin family protein [Candidatus Acidoferrales bacterium]|nr:phage holin family protein [Candidatus Acidoferrales bacterium]
MMSRDAGHTRSLAEILAEAKDELKEFFETRVELLRREMNERIAALKIAAPLALVGGMFLGTAFLLFSLALVALFAAVFRGSEYRWFFGFLLVGFLWSVIGGTAALLAKKRISKRSIVPQKTIEVLAADKAWLQNEARSVL